MNYNWKLYFDHDDGKKAISLFDFENGDILGKADKIIENNIDYLNGSLDNLSYEMSFLNEFVSLIRTYAEDIALVYESPRQFLDALLDHLNAYVEDLKTCSGKTYEYQVMATFIPILSLALSIEVGLGFYPVLFVKDFLEFQNRCKILGISIPMPPKESERRNRCLYYADICQAIEDFRVKNALTKPQTLTLLYGYAAYISSENKKAEDFSNLPAPTHIYMAGANKNGEGDIDILEECDVAEWQGGKRAKAGDICVVYAVGRCYIHSIWRMLTDTIYNPFDFHCFRIKLGYKIKIPKLSLKFLQSNSATAQVGYVRGNMRGLDGNKELKIQDYNLLIDAMKLIDPSFKSSVLPRIEGFTFDEFEGKEKEVTIKFLEEKLLPALNYSPNDWVKELQLRLGRTNVEDNEHSKKGRPDVTVLHRDLGLDQKYAPLVFEVKLDFEKEDFNDVIKQGVSYARMLHSKYLALCDKRRLVILKRRDKYFKESDVVFDHTWEELKDPGLKQVLYDMIGKHVIKTVSD